MEHYRIRRFFTALGISFVYLVFWAQTSYGCDITVFGNYQKYPKSFLDKNGPNGILIDMFEYVGKNMGCNFEIRLHPWKRAYGYMLRGDGGVMGLSKSSERLKIIDYSDVMYYDDLLLVVRKGEEFEYGSLEDLRGKTIVHNRGSSYGDEWERGVREKIFISREHTGNMSAKLLFLLYGRADIALIGPGIIGFNKAINAEQRLIKDRNKLVILERPFKRDPNYLGFAKKSNMKDFIKEFNKFLKKGKKPENGEKSPFQKIIAKYR